jgi:hypothetical protein
MEIGGIIVGGGCNVIYGNTIRDSFQGLVMCDFFRSKYGSQNLIFHNNFINNTPLQAVGAPHASNNYDNGYPSGGNYARAYSLRRPKGFRTTYNAPAKTQLKNRKLNKIKSFLTKTFPNTNLNKSLNISNNQKTIKRSDIRALCVHVACFRLIND